MTDRGAIESIAETLCPPHCHNRVGTGGTTTNHTTGEMRSWCETGGVCAIHLADAERILDRLAADGYSVVKTGGWQHSITEPLEPDRLPQPMSLDLCRRRITARRELTESSGADPSLMPVLLRRPLLVQFPWEPVPEGSEDEQ